MAGEVGLEPTVFRLTADCCTNSATRQKWWTERELNSRPFACKANALPLSYRPREWWQREGSNLRRAAFQTAALPTELLRRDWSGRRELNSRQSRWQRDTLPLSYARIVGEGGRTRTCEGVSRQIYSLTPLPLGSLPRLFGCASTDLNRRRQRMRLHRGLFTYSYYRASSLIIDNLAYGARRASLLKVRVGGRGVDLNPRDAFSTPTRFRDERLRPDSATLPFGGGSVI